MSSLALNESTNPPTTPTTSITPQPSVHTSQVVSETTIKEIRAQDATAAKIGALKGPEEKVVDVVDETKDPDDQKPGKRHSKPATLYCPETNQPHATLLSYGWTTCQRCQQSLVKTTIPGLPGPDLGRDNSESDDESKEAPLETEEDAAKKADIPKHLKVDHEVEFRDLGNYSIASQNWGRPFDLEKERNAALKLGSAKRKETVFKIITVIRTGVAPNPRRTDFERRDFTKHGIIGNPQASLAVQFTRIVIMSRLFIDALKSVMSYDTDDNLLETGKLALDEPFPIIGHHLDKLKAYVRDRGEAGVPSGADEEVARETCTHVGLVLDFVGPILQKPIEEELGRHNRDIPTCTYRMMWYLLRPGETVYVMSDEAQDAYMVNTVEMDQFDLSSTDINRACRLVLWNLDFDGQHVTRTRFDIFVKPFEGEKPITSLEVVPCKIWDKHDGGKLRSTLEERGKKWAKHSTGTQIEYKGEPFKPGRKTVNGRAYTDTASYYSLDGNEPDFWPMHSTKKRRGSVSSASSDSSDDEMELKPNKSWSKYDDISITELGGVTDSLGQQIGYLLCSRKLQGFVFGTRTWETLDIRYCMPSKPDKNPFARLVMPEDRKMMIKALVYKYTDARYAGDSSQVWGADFIKHKGEGQVFLLHGGPGVGKTFTAECIAEFTGRPLLALTCGDIGTEEVEMEKKLRSWLQLAYKWGAVMLIDEADVFLEKRMDNDLKRNSLVSVFLREIEYYQGILFLTSNRVGKFDDAIVSRIHVVIHYKGLDDEYREKIWRQFFDKLQKERGSKIRIESSAENYVLHNKKMVEMKWNGREIRNAFQTAVALAEYRFLTKPEAEKEEGEIAVLEEQDFKQICDMTMKFKEYLTEMNEGQDEAMRARIEKLRVD